MSVFALISLGLTFGWLLCLFTLSSAKPKIFDFFAFVFDSEWRPPVAFKLASARQQRRELMKEASASRKQRQKLIKFWFALVVFGATTVLIAIELLQNFRSAQAAAMENVVTAPSVAALVLASTIGFAARLYKREIAAGIATMSQIALVGGGGTQEKKADADGKGASNTAINYVDAKFPWYIEIGLLLSIVLFVIFWINPQLLKNLTSFKAAGVEAHFATVTGSATVQSGLIVQVDPARKTVSKGWATFDYPLKKEDPRYDTYQGEGVKEMSDAANFLDAYIKPAFVFVNDVNSKKTPDRSDIDDHLSKLAVELSRIIRSGVEDNQYGDTAINLELSELCKYFLSVDTNMPCRFRNKFDPKYLNKKIWDAYIIQSVADLLLVLEQRTEQENFIIATSSGKTEADICPDKCQTAGQLSLMYDLVLTKVRSTRPWPFADTLKQLSGTLDGVDLVLDRNEAKRARNQSVPQSDVECRCEKTNSLFRRNRFMDISLGLELFYQRDLQGQRFTPYQMRIWRDWLGETRAVIDTLDERVVAWPPPFSDDVRKSWLRARADILSRPDVLQDAYVGIALSLVLIGSAEGDVSDHDCNEAHAFLARADSGLPHYFDFAQLDADDKATYRGFLEQVNTSVESRCRQ